ncbi:FAD-binding and (Fe-S)-binding domain-containing protein [Naasia lichenicola]|uniref:FAD-binding oxidoreductase n=1 Tax=Naasia lichenicola TaxID=2565933 RepID=A0A4S4FM57_9MICO|nr:FAD-binding and (Fe-S)-binding domain-containing protein [Naasia lichenicola]THG31570.1 FAD-binding oxidoreductase [Naasia lichenicola]
MQEAHVQQSSSLLTALSGSVRGEVSEAPIRRAQYSTDASNYRVPPSVVVYPTDASDLATITQISRELAVPMTLRGGGTSVAGNAIGTGILVDTSVHMNRVLDIDPSARTARVEPGTVMSTLQAAAAPFGLRFGPDPSTQSRATLGGMIGNNACGPHAVAYGRTSDNVIDLDVVDGRGRRFLAGKDLTVVPGLEELVSKNLAVLRTELGTFGRQVSGYSLEHLLPENGRNLARALVGTEGTVATVLESTVRLVPISPSPVLVVLGYADMAAAADDVPALLTHHPLAMEGMDARLVDVVRTHSRGQNFPVLPPGGGWLMIEIGGETPAEAIRAAELLAADAATRSVRIVPAGPEAAAIWRMRADGAGLAGRTAGGRQAWPGWEDAAVPPASLGVYLREFDALMDEFGVEGLAYGHFGDGCVHVRIDLPLERDGDALRAFTTRAAELVVSHGGSLSGEHGDGRARSELLGQMYSPEALRIFEAFKHLFDPENLLNPGIIVAPRALDVDLRRPTALPILRTSGFAFGEDEGDFTKAIHRCVGVGKCRADNSASGGFMCPSFLATKDETHVTRGRARVLQELSSGTFGPQAWKAEEVHDALDLCLSCKACASDCPAGVDMAKYKSEVLHRTYEGKVRPINHYVLGWLPRWSRLAGVAPSVVNAITRIPFVQPLVLRLGGMDPRRSIPKFAAKPFLRSERRTGRRSGVIPKQDPARPKVVLWVDSFSDAFSPDIPRAAIAVLEDAGYQVLIPDQEACCGLTWISTGQLTAAKTKLRGLLDVFGPFAAAGIPIIGLEPSCTAVLRSDLVDLLPEDPRSHQVSDATRTLAEMLTGTSSAAMNGWTPPDLSDVTAVVQPHCHQHAVMGFDADTSILAAGGATITTLAGCCGLAGNFGMEKGHYETSVAVAENALLPALRSADSSTVFLADGFSCRTQADQLAGVQGRSLAELLADHLRAPGDARRAVSQTLGR